MRENCVPAKLTLPLVSFGALCAEKCGLFHPVARVAGRGGRLIVHEMPPSSGSGLLTIATRRARETVNEVVEQLGGDSWLKAQNMTSRAEATQRNSWYLH